MRRGRRGRGRSAAAAPGTPAAGFGASSSSSSSSDGEGPAKRPRANQGRIFLRTAAASDAFLEQLKQQVDVAVPPPLDGGDDARKGSFDAGDPTTTNLFVGNLHPQTDEAALQAAFGRFGPIASIKIMWPRGDDERARGHNSGFVAFTHRADAEAAYANLHERIDGHAVRLAWGKAVRREPAPLPPLAGQVYGGTSTHSVPRVIVQPPLNVARRREIDRLAAAAVAAAGVGAAAGAGVDQPTAPPSGLADEEQIYFRWRVHSLASGETETRWRTALVAVDDGGALWDPPTCAAPIQDAVEAAAPEPGPEPEPEPEPKPEQENGGLEAVARLDERLDAASMAQLEALLDGLDTTRGSIARAMVFCVDQSRRAGDVAAVLGRRLLSLPARGATPAAGLGVVYLVADVLANGDSAGAHAHRARLGAVVELAFRDGLRVWLDAMPGRIAAHGVAVGVTRVLDAWRQSRVFPEPFVEALRRAVFGDADVHAL